MLRIARLANFYAPTSGGLRTALDRLGRGYVAHGHRCLLVVPGRRDRTRETEAGTIVELASPPLLGSGGYRLITRLGAVAWAVERFGPTSVEVSDKLTLRRFGPWAQARGVGAVLFSHERLDRFGGVRRPVGRRGQELYDVLNRRLAAGYDLVVCCSAWSAEEFRRIGVRTRQVPLGVDLWTFRPADRAGEPPSASSSAPPAGVELLHVGRLAPEKRPDLAIGALRVLRRSGVDARLTVVGDGPWRRALAADAADLPVSFRSHVADRAELAAIIAAADVVLSPGPVETFGLAALEALACGVAVVAGCRGAVPELLGPCAGVATAGTPEGLADGVRLVCSWPAGPRRAAARAVAGRFPWSRAIESMLALHGQVGRDGTTRTARGNGTTLRLDLRYGPRSTRRGRTWRA